MLSKLLLFWQTISASFGRVFIIVSLVSIFLSCVRQQGQGPTLKREETFYRYCQEPKTLHPIKSWNHCASKVKSLVLESLLQRNPDTYAWEPSLAQKWEQSPDGKSFLFYLHKGLKWSDGKPLTAKDAEFTLKTYQNPAYRRILLRHYFKIIKSAEVVDDYTIRFHTKEKYFKGFDILADMKILPRHIYHLKEGTDSPSTDMITSRSIIGSGPYKLIRYENGKMIVLTKNPDWFGKNVASNKGKWNFKNIVFRFVLDHKDAHLRMQKGELDFTWLSAPEFEKGIFYSKQSGRIQKVQYKVPTSGYSYIGLNLKNTLFQDRRVRKALSHLVNWELLNRKLNFSHYERASGPWPPWSEYADPSLKPVLFDSVRAAELLKEAGWRDQDKDGILEKQFPEGKKKFSFSILSRRAWTDASKHLTIIQEDFKKAGIHLTLKFLDSTAFLSVLQERNFEAVFYGKNVAMDMDPKPDWHSKSRQKGDNFIGYSNPKVDKLIDQAIREFDKEKRIKLLKEVYRLIVNDRACLFGFYSRYGFYAVNKRIHTPKPSFPYDLGMPFWSFKAVPP